jgi:NAD(P)-dependent dehydrogenase (short-subunit alcohol dehydrogenase family)
MVDRLKNKVAVITGGCSGIGLATVELFIAEGANVVVADILTEQGAALEKRFSSKLRFIRCDVTREDEIAASIELAVSTFGGVDITFNNAGAVGTSDDIECMQAENWDYTMNLLVRSAMFGIKHSIGPMKLRGGGAIINTSSVAAVVTGPPAYCAAKAAVLHLAHAAALELAPYNIRVNSVMPGFISTPIFGGMMGLQYEKSKQLADLVAKSAAHLQPLQIAGRPEDIAEAVLYFASDAAAFVTGTELRIDGGVTLIPQMELNPEKPGSIGQVMATALQAIDLT